MLAHRPVVPVGEGILRSPLHHSAAFRRMEAQLGGHLRDPQQISFVPKSGRGMQRGPN